MLSTPPLGYPNYPSHQRPKSFLIQHNRNTMEALPRTPGKVKRYNEIRQRCMILYEEREGGFPSGGRSGDKDLGCRKGGGLLR